MVFSELKRWHGNIATLYLCCSPLIFLSGIGVIQAVVLAMYLGVWAFWSLLAFLEEGRKSTDLINMEQQLKATQTKNDELVVKVNELTTRVNALQNRTLQRM